MSPLQEWIYRLEVGGGKRLLLRLSAVLAFGVTVAAYNLLEFRNLSRPDAMEMAQTARNLARGEGFTTRCIRPLSIHLVEKREVIKGLQSHDFSRLATHHPDLSNPPVYPTLLAAVMKVLPFPEKASPRSLSRYATGDLFIALLNQGLFLCLLILVYRLALRLFDPEAALLAMSATFGSALMWRLTVSGTATLLLQILFLLLVAVLLRLREEPNDEDDPEPDGSWSPLAVAALAGAIVGLGMLTRYSFGWLLIPLTLFLLVTVKQHRITSALLTVAVCALVVAPWLTRNFSESGTLFGTAGFAWMEDTRAFPADTLQRSLVPNLSEVEFRDLAKKVMIRSENLLTQHLPTLGGSWATAFFLAGVLLPLTSQRLRRLRHFTVGSILIALPVVTLTLPPASSNPIDGVDLGLLLVFAPVVFILGAAMCATLLDQHQYENPGLRNLVVRTTAAVFCLPLIIALMPPRQDPRVFPLYQPPVLGQIADWTEPDELLMSNQPWAVAWYGDRQCVWTTLRENEEEHLEDFHAVSAYRKPIAGLHLSWERLNKGFWTLKTASPGTWEAFLLQAVEQQKLPASFPLRHTPGSLLQQSEFFVTDRQRWRDADPNQLKEWPAPEGEKPTTREGFPPDPS